MPSARMPVLVALGAVAALAPLPAAGVILYPSATRNGTPLPDSIAYPAWQLQGQFSAFLGTPISAQYFITASHIGGDAHTPFIFQGSSYTIDATFGVGGRMVLPGSDLTVWKVTGVLPAYAPLYSGDDEKGQRAVIIGRGTQRGDEVRVNGQLKGWLWGNSDGLQSWGENDISEVLDAGGVGQILQFTFNAGNSPNECTLSVGDSGGGVFIQDEGVWKLAAINYAVEGPFSTSSTGSAPFMAALFDKRGLYQQSGDKWVPVSGPSAAYASRISSRASSIFAIAPGCPVVEQNYTVQATVSMGTVDVAGTIRVGNGTDTAALTATYVRAGSVTIESNASVLIAPNGTSAGTSVIRSLQIAATGVLDLSDNNLIVRANALSRDAMLNQIADWIGTARNSPAGAWLGNGITSSAAAANPLTGLGLSLNDRGNGTPLLTEFDGQAVDINTILVKYTWNGDADLSGAIDADDYFLIDRGFLRQLSSYRNGDFNYDGAVTADDYQLIDAAFLAQHSRVTGAVTVPEPGAAAILGLGTAGFVLRKRSKTPKNTRCCH